MRITIAIPTFNRADQLAETLRSVSAVNIPCAVRCQVLVVDNASTDATPGVVQNAAETFRMPLRYVVEPQLGLCYGRNRALAETDDDYVIYLDDDVRVGAGWLRGYVDAFSQGADCVVGPVLPVFPTELPPYATGYMLALLGSEYSRKGDHAFALPAERANEIPGCNFGVRRDVGVAVGGFDTSLDRVGQSLLAGGDSEFGIRLTKAGKRILYSPECAIEHILDPGKLERAQLRRRAEGLGRTAARVRSKHGPRRSARDWLRASQRGVGLWLRWRLRQLTGTPSESFEWELRTRRHLQDLRASLEGVLSDSRQVRR